ncbi:MAG: TMEM143 family protein [Pirellulaceae bacterium]
MHRLEEKNVVKRSRGSGEHFVPLHTTDLVEYLTQHPALTGNEGRFRLLASLILSLLHHLYRQRHEQLTYVYAPLDPDRDCLLMNTPTDDYRDRLCEELLERTRDTLRRANYRRLSPQEIQTALRAASQWGVRMRVNFSALRRLEVYTRGDVKGNRTFRSWRKFFRIQTVAVPLHQRLVVVFRFANTTPQFDCRHVYLRMFKNVPQQDIDMMLPATGIQMTWLDHSKIVVPSLYAAAITLWRFLRNVVLLTLFGVFKTIGLVILVLFAIGFGIKSMFTYRTNTKRRYMLNMAQSLYYQNLDNNAGVLLRLLEEGEQQEACEAVLAYFVLAVELSEQGPQSLQAIDAACERILFDATGLHVDFDIDSTLRTLIHLGIVRVDEAGWRGLALQEATTVLDKTWDSWFND